MKTGNKILPLLLSAILVSSALTGCGDKAPSSSVPDSGNSGNSQLSSSEKNSADVPESLTISWFCNEMSKDTMDKEIPTKAVEMMSEAAGTKVSIDPVLFTWDTYNEKIKLYVASKKFDDVFYMNDSVMIDELGQKGLILDLENYKDSAPNFFKYLDNEYEYNRLINGTYIFGYAKQPTDDEGTQWVWVDRFDTFKEHGLSHPETLDELYNVCKELKGIYPDSYPLGSGVAATWYGVPMVFFNINKTNSSFYWDGTEYKYGPVQDEEAIKAALLYLNQMYAEKLLDPEFMTVTDEQVLSKMATGKNFILPNWWCAELNKGNTNGVEWGMVARPLNYQNERGWKPSSDPARNPQMEKVGFVVSAATKYPDLVVKAVDSLYSDKGAELKWWGVEGKTFQVDGNGVKSYIKPYAEMNDLFAETGFGRFPNVIIDQNATRVEKTPCFLNGEYLEENGYRFTDAAEGADSIAPRTLPLNFTKEENEKISTPRTALDTYFDEMCNKFITGKESFDNWDAFMEQLKKTGDYQSVLDIYNAKVTEFKANNP